MVSPCWFSRTSGRPCKAAAAEEHEERNLPGRQDDYATNQSKNAFSWQDEDLNIPLLVFQRATLRDTVTHSRGAQ